MVNEAARPKAKILYLVPDLSDPAVGRRKSMLEAGGAKVILSGFLRGAAPQPDDTWGAEVLGRTRDAELMQRALKVLSHLVRPWSLLRRTRGHKVVVARNLEMLVLAWAGLGLARSRARLGYEVLDIHRAMLGSGIKSRALRLIEGLLLKRVDFLILSSEAFDRAYFSKLQSTSADRLLIENKVLVLDVSPPAPRPVTQGPPWRIGWFGMIRCKRSLAILERLTSESPGLIEVDIRGRPSTAVFGKNFSGTVAAMPGLTFHGAYRPEDLSDAYASVHFVWAIDFFEEGQNSDWLLPNRLYEGNAHGRPLLAQRHVETGRWLERHRAGSLFDDLEKELPLFFDALSLGSFQDLIKSVEDIPREALVCNASDCRDLVDQLMGYS